MFKQIGAGLLVAGLTAGLILTHGSNSPVSPTVHAAGAGAAETPLQAANYVADSAHSTVGFSVPIAGGLSAVRGKFAKFDVQISFDEKDPMKSSVTATIDASSIDTGIEPRDKHLRAPDFFDVEKFPSITFQSKRIAKQGKGYVAVGDFTMHGVTKEISIPFTLSPVQMSPPNNAKVFGFKGTLTIDRRDYGVAYARQNNPDFIGNMVDIELAVLMRPPMPPMPPRPPQ